MPRPRAVEACKRKDMSTELVRGELERLFSLEEMMALSGDLLDLDPGELGGTASKASFARSLLDRCVEVGAVDALVDAMVALRTETDARVREIAKSGLVMSEELAGGAAFGPFTIVRKIAEGPRAIVYAARNEGA